MRLNPQAADAGGIFQLAPLIDIVFVVLIFFIATYAAQRDEKLQGLNLPTVSQGVAEARQREQIYVNLNARGEIFVQSRKLEAAALERILGQMATFATADHPPTVVVRADGDCPHRFVAQVLDLCARAGIAGVYFSAYPAADLPLNP
jgi:biopolymer transport protein ExbD